MSTAELVMDRRVVWNSLKLKEIDEAKATYMAYKRQGYLILAPDGSPLERFKPRLEEFIIKATKVCKKVLKILCDKGDERLVWDRENGQEAKEAKAKFVQFMNQGYKAYSVDAQGNKNKRIEEFDVDAEEILMVPKTVKG